MVEFRKYVSNFMISITRWSYQKKIYEFMTHAYLKLDQVYKFPIVVFRPLYVVSVPV